MGATRVEPLSPRSPSFAQALLRSSRERRTRTRSREHGPGAENTDQEQRTRAGGKWDPNLTVPVGRMQQPRGRRHSSWSPWSRRAIPSRLKTVPSLQCHCPGWIPAARSCRDETFLSLRSQTRLLYMGKHSPATGFSLRVNRRSSGRTAGGDPGCLAGPGGFTLSGTQNDASVSGQSSRGEAEAGGGLRATGQKPFLKF